MLFDSNSGSGVDYYDLLSILILAHGAISDSEVLCRVHKLSRITATLYNLKGPFHHLHLHLRSSLLHFNCLSLLRA